MQLLQTVAKAACASLFASSALVALLTAPPTGCRIMVKNNGTEQSPSYVPDCDGSCVAPQSDPCTVDYVQGRGEYGVITVYFCECNGVQVPPTSAQGCTGNWNNSGGWHFVCQKAGCQNACVASGNPAPGTTIYGCTCPDV